MLKTLMIQDGIMEYTNAMTTEKRVFKTPDPNEIHTCCPSAVPMLTVNRIGRAIINIITTNITIAITDFLLVQ